MKKSLYLLIVVVLAMLSLSVKPAAAALPVFTTNIGCGTIDLSGSGTAPVGSYPIFDYTKYSIVGSITFVQNGGNFTGHGTFSAKPGDFLEAYYSYFTVPACNGVTWFNPGDARIDPQPGDRLAVYCNINTTGPKANTIGILGILDDGTGVPVALVNYADLVKAGGAGVTVNGSNGSIVLFLTSPNTFFVRWWGGPAFADGTGDFRKHFSCTFS